ncbi:MAG: LytS/YhcK type 5TM receptor domain-containing protein [Pseudomonadota bacterium]
MAWAWGLRRMTLGDLMYDQLELFVSSAMAFSLIAFASLFVANLETWGQSRGLGRVLAGLLLGLVSAAQMFAPIEPFPGVIIDFRVIPLVLAGAFLNLPGALTAGCMAAMARLSIGGDGAAAGVLAIGMAVSVGIAWRMIIPHLPFGKYAGRLLLGVGASLTLASGLLLPSPIAGWFFGVPSMMLAMIYAVSIPGLAWVLDNKYAIESGLTNTGREALSIKGIRLLSVPALMRYLRTRDADDPETSPRGGLAIRLHFGRATTAYLRSAIREEALEAVLMRIKEAWPDMPPCALTHDRAVLLPLGVEDILELDRLKARLSEAITDRPLMLAGIDKVDITAQFELMSQRRLAREAVMRPIPMTALGLSEPRTPAPFRRLVARRATVVPVDRAGLLFQKADLLAKKSNW